MSLYDHPRSRAAIDALFEHVWPGLPARLALAARLGADWYRVSTPFALIESGRAIAHVGVIEIPLVMEGRRTVVAGIHAVCCHPEARRRGHVGRLLQRALAHADAKRASAQLTTELPRVFVPQGFRSLAQTCFEIRVPARGQRGFRRLSQHEPGDVRLLHRLLGERTPVSHRLGMVEGPWLAIINEVLSEHGLARFHYCEELDTIVVFERKGGTLELLDVIAAELPTIDEILSRIDGDHDRVLLYVTPDRLGGEIVARHPAWPADHIMARGPYPPEGDAFVLPPLAHC